MTRNHVDTREGFGNTTLSRTGHERLSCKHRTPSRQLAFVSDNAFEMNDLSASGKTD
jgi:hypothetical protein